MIEFFKHLLHEFETPLKNPVLIFSLILFIILLSPIVLKKLNIPGIIGLIISGVIIGPHGFDILQKDSAVDLFSTIGLLYIMFIAGLELDMNEFKSNRNKSLLFGLFTFLFPISIGFPVCYYLLGYSFNASFLTASMFATHTLVAYPIVSKLGIAKNQAVAITVGGTILTDTAVLLILAVIMGNNEGNLNEEFWIRLGVSLVIFSAIMFFVIPRIARWFFRKLESEKHSHYIFVLSVVFFAAFLAEVSGVEPIIGAFVAGLALNKLIPHSSALMNRIEFIGNSLFIPFFLISVGMLVDISVILSGPMALIVAGTLSVVALFGKWFAAFFTQLVFKYSKAQRQLIFGLSSAHAAATLAVILVGYKAKILDENILNGTIILILITCIVASFATEKAAKKIILEDDTLDHSSLNGKRSLLNEYILVSAGEKSDIQKYLEFSLLIKEKKSPNPISILSVVPNDEEAEINIIKSRNKLEEYVKQASATEMKANVITTIDHNISSGIARTSREIMADIIIIEWQNKINFFDKLMGDKIETIISKVDKTILICDFKNSLISSKRIVLISPPLSEKENGFGLWLSKLTKLSKELSIPMVHYGDGKTQESIAAKMKANGYTAPIEYKAFNDWEDFLILSRDLNADDLIVFVSSRKGAVSYMNILDAIPVKLNKFFERNNKVLVYPQQYESAEFENDFEDISSGTITKGIESISKQLQDLFKKNKKEN